MRLTIALTSITLLLTLTAEAKKPSRQALLDALTAPIEEAPAATETAEPSETAPQAEAEPVQAVEEPAPKIVAIAPLRPAPRAVAPEAAEPPKTKGTPLKRGKKRTPLDSLRERDGDSNASTSYLLVGLALLGLGAVAWWLKRRATRGNPWAAAAHSMETIAVHRVAGKHMVGLVRVPGRVLVVGINDKGLTLLTELDESDVTGVEATVAAGAVAGAENDSFADRFARLRDSFNAGKNRDPFQAALEEEEAPVDELMRLDERAAIRERLEALRTRVA